MRVYFQMFRSRMSSWETLYQQAADFASQLAPQRLISIGHSEDQNDGVVTVWYWGEDDDKAPGPERTTEG